MDNIRGSSPTKNAVNQDSPEQLIDAFKAAALSVTKLYKTSAAAQSKARSDGYQDCLDDLLIFLDRNNIGLNDGEGWRIRRWATERLDGREGPAQAVESEDEVDKPEAASSELPRPADSAADSGNPDLPASARPDTQMRTDATPSAPLDQHRSAPDSPVAVPTLENFTFQSSQAYPALSQVPSQDAAYPNLAKLDLSDSSKPADSTTQNPTGISISQSPRPRLGKRVARPSSKASTSLGKGAGQKRSINFAELFDVGSINFGKDIFGRDGKRSRHT